MRLLLPLLLCFTLTASAQKFEGLALTPPMGWNTWNTFAGDINEVLIKQTADALVKSGMRDAGYIYVVLDDAWLEKKRDANGNVVGSSEKFPSGMKALGDYLHERGFKFGIYNCAGAKTCAGYPGGRGHEFQDARTYASWGVDYLKYDWCEHGTADAKETYKIMSDALREAGRPIVFSLCEWGDSKPWTWATNVGHLWRTTGDIMDCYECRQQWSMGWKNILDFQAQNELHKYSGPGQWNDPDMLEVGNKGLTFAESRAHFSLWCILAAPLMAGNDVRSMTPEIRDILTNREAIAIDQDSLGKQGWRFRVEASREIWVRELSGGDWAVCVLNAGSQAAEVELDWDEIHLIKKGKFTVRDIWGKKDLGKNEGVHRAKLDSHDVMFFRVTPAK